MSGTKPQRLILMLLLCTIMVFILPSAKQMTASAAENPTALSNLNVGLRKYSHLVTTADGGYMRLFTESKDSADIRIEYYDSSFNLLSKKTIKRELPIWGGFYKGSDSYYICLGQNNTEEQDNKEVFRVIRYDYNWNKTGSASITGNKDEIWGSHVRYPFDYGCLEMSEYNGKLFLTTGHEGYVDPQYNQGHQGYLLMMVDIASMKGKIIDADLWHSFAQYIQNDGSGLFIYEQSEGSRCTTLARLPLNDLISGAENGSIDYWSIGNIEKKEQVFKYGGTQTSAWAIACYATVDGLALSADNAIGIGTSIDQSKYDSFDYSTTPYNIYLTVTPKNKVNEGKTNIKWLTSYTNSPKRFKGAFITKISDDRFLVTWGESDDSGTAADLNDPLSAYVLHYLFIDGSGNKIGSERTFRGAFSDCKPVISGSKAVFCSSDSSVVSFYTIDTSTGSYTKKYYRSLGDNVTWDFKDGVLTISGNGDLKTDGSAFSGIKDQITKIVIKSGVTSIPDSAFTSMSSLETVTIEPGLKTIGSQAFAYSMTLDKVYIPKSVTSIGDDIVWTGYYWVADGNPHVYYATIYTNYNSAAYTYAKNNNIKVMLDISDASVTGLNTSYTATGSPIVPDITVKLGGKTLVKDTDYTVSCKNNTAVGTAEMTITGTEDYNGYFGTLTKTFNIVQQSKKDISTCTVTLSGSSFTYTGSAIKPSVTVKDGSKTLKADTDYTVSYSANINAGTATVTVTGTGNYKGSVSKNFTITAKALTEQMLTLSGSSFTYTGSAIKPSVTVKDGTKTLKQGTDYTVTYNNNVNVGTATVKITGINNYKGTVSKSFTITAKTNFIYGDANGDGTVNGADVSMIQKYNCGWTINIDLSAADVNLDGKIDGIDCSLIQKKLCGWDIELGRA